MSFTKAEKIEWLEECLVVANQNLHMIEDGEENKRDCIKESKDVRMIAAIIDHVKTSTAVEYLKDREKMCADLDMDCSRCPFLQHRTKGEMCGCIDAEAEVPEVSVQIVNAWKENHKNEDCSNT